MLRKHRAKILIGLCIVIILILIFNLDHISAIKTKASKFDVDYIQEIVESFGALGVIVYILINCIRPLLFIPTTVMYVSGGLIYGNFKGPIYTLIGLIGGSSIPFFLARKFKPLFKRILGNKYSDKINEIEDGDIIRRLFTIRVTPALPFDIISYAAGMSNTPYKEFLIGTLLGAFPKIVLYSFLGDQLDNMFSLRTIAVFFALLALAASPHIFRNKFQTFNK